MRKIDAAEAFLSAIDEAWLAVRESDVVAFITNEGLDVAGGLKATLGLDDVRAEEYQRFADDKVRLARSRVAAEGPNATWQKLIAEARESLAKAQLAESKVALLFRPVELSDAAGSVLFRLERLIDDLDRPEITAVNSTMKSDFEDSRKRFVTSAQSALYDPVRSRIRRRR